MASRAASKITLPGLSATVRLAERCAAGAHKGDVFALRGDLGAGKTAFARAFIHAFARARGAPEEDVPSPTFTLVQVYEFSDVAVYHIDLYRIDEPGAAAELGLEDAFADGISLIEWPERLGDLLPPDRLELALNFAAEPDARTCTVTGFGAWCERMAEVIADG